MNDRDNKQILTVEDLCKRWQCSQPHVRMLCQRKEKPLKHFRLGKLYRFRLADVTEFEANQAKGAA